MNITKEYLITALESSYNPYPSFAKEGAEDEYITRLRKKHKRYIRESLKAFESLGEGISEDFRDDCHNCGRNALAKFMELRELLIILYAQDTDAFDEVMDTITEEICQDIDDTTDTEEVTRIKYPTRAEWLTEHGFTCQDDKWTHPSYPFTLRIDFSTDEAYYTNDDGDHIVGKDQITYFTNPA